MASARSGGGITMPEYIEREALLEEIRMSRNYLLLGKTAAAKLEKMVKSAPAAAVEPVRHGRWVKVSPRREASFCSKCGVSAVKVFGEYFTSNYCPNCGAKMDLEET